MLGLSGLFGTEHSGIQDRLNGIGQNIQGVHEAAFSPSFLA